MIEMRRLKNVYIYIYILVFTGRYFRAEYALIVLSVKLLLALIIDALRKSLVYCYYVVCN